MKANWQFQSNYSTWSPGHNREISVLLHHTYNCVKWKWVLFQNKIHYSPCFSTTTWMEAIVSSTSSWSFRTGTSYMSGLSTAVALCTTWVISTTTRVSSSSSSSSSTAILWAVTRLDISKKVQPILYFSTYNMAFFSTFIARLRFRFRRAVTR